MNPSLARIPQSIEMGPIGDSVTIGGDVEIYVYLLHNGLHPPKNIGVRKSQTMSYKSRHGVNDLILLDSISNESILQTLQNRFQADEIYTFIGQVLIAINPFRDIRGLYGSGVMKSYVSKTDYQNPPHAYTVAERAYRSMLNNLGKECIIITGESGAGKTQSSHIILDYIAGVSSKAADVEKVKDKLLESNVLLEAFGNAKTLRNNNSSRFGKYFSMVFDAADPQGGVVSVYLLEKHRIIDRQIGERSFHVLYQMLAGHANGCISWPLSLHKSRSMDEMVSHYRFLSSSQCSTIERVDDLDECRATLKSMAICNLDEFWQSQVKFFLPAAVFF